MSRQDPAPALSDCTRWQDRLPAKAMIGDETIAEYLARQREEQKRVRAIPYREETLDVYGNPVHDLEAKAFRAAPYHGWPL